MKKSSLIIGVSLVFLLNINSHADQTNVVLDSTVPRTVDKVLPITSNSVTQKETYYFDFDKASTIGEQLATLRQHAERITSSNVKVRIEGHADERGADKYNHELGKERAEFVANELAALGVSKNNLEVVSHGKNKPVSSGHDEESWQSNRRVEITYLS